MDQVEQHSLVKVCMSPERAEMFLKFCEFEEQIMPIIRSGMLTKKNQSISIYINEVGQIKSIQREIRKDYELLWSL